MQPALLGHRRLTRLSPDPRSVTVTVRARLGATALGTESSPAPSIPSERGATSFRRSPYTNDHGATSTYPGLNWSTNGQAIWKGGCLVDLTPPEPPETTTTTTHSEVTTTTSGSTTTHRVLRPPRRRIRGRAQRRRPCRLPRPRRQPHPLSGAGLEIPPNPIHLRSVRKSPVKGELEGVDRCFVVLPAATVPISYCDRTSHPSFVGIRNLKRVGP